MPRRTRKPTLWLTWFAVLACSPSYEVLTDASAGEPGTITSGAGGGGSGEQANGGGGSPVGGSGATADGGVSPEGGSGATADGGAPTDGGGGGASPSGGGNGGSGAGESTGGDGAIVGGGFPIGGSGAFPVGAGGAYCTDDNGCAGSQVCEGSQCHACDYLFQLCDQDCPAGWMVPGAEIRNGCPACECIQCDSHAQCAFGKVCNDGVCAPCDEPVTEEDCAPDCDRLAQRSMLVERNGCQVCECVPASECWTDADCDDPQLCFPGQRCNCPDGAVIPDCCDGNRCAMPECPPTEVLPCSLVGCPDGQVCESPCAPPVCWCDGPDWVCDPEEPICEDTSCRRP